MQPVKQSEMATELFCFQCVDAKLTIVIDITIYWTSVFAQSSSSRYWPWNFLLAAISLKAVHMKCNSAIETWTSNDIGVHKHIQEQILCWSTSFDEVYNFKMKVVVDGMIKVMIVEPSGGEWKVDGAVRTVHYCTVLYVRWRCSNGAYVKKRTYVCVVRNR